MRLPSDTRALVIQSQMMQRLNHVIVYFSIMLIICECLFSLLKFGPKKQKINRTLTFGEQSRQCRAYNMWSGWRFSERQGQATAVASSGDWSQEILQIQILHVLSSQTENIDFA